MNISIEENNGVGGMHVVFEVGFCAVPFEVVHICSYNQPARLLAFCTRRYLCSKWDCHEWVQPDTWFYRHKAICSRHNRFSRRSRGWCVFPGLETLRIDHVVASVALALFGLAESTASKWFTSKINTNFCNYFSEDTWVGFCCALKWNNSDAKSDWLTFLEVICLQKKKCLNYESDRGKRALAVCHN